LELNKESFNTKNFSGTIGYTAPEILNNETRLTNSVDIFALGCTIYYFYTNGKHPFGERLEREMNIVKNKVSFKDINDLLLVDLLKKMLEPNSSKRISAKDALKHHYFWSDKRKLDFLCDVSDQLGKEKNSEVGTKLELKKRHIYQSEDPWITWDKFLDEVIVKNLSKFRKYDYSSFCELLRCIRNIKSHYREYDEEFQKIFVKLPEGVFIYFGKIFPLLFHTVYKIIEKSEWKLNDIFQNYF
jgi:serine/threonine-protein kinase/endoribonuclease IRE1